MYYYNATTGQSSWERPADMGQKRPGGKSKGPPGANLFIACKGSHYLGDEQLRQSFEPYGQVLRAEMTVDKDTGARAAPARAAGRGVCVRERGRAR